MKKSFKSLFAAAIAASLFAVTANAATPAPKDLLDKWAVSIGHGMVVPLSDDLPTMPIGVLGIPEVTVNIVYAQPSPDGTRDYVGTVNVYLEGWVNMKYDPRTGEVTVVLNLANSAAQGIVHSGYLIRGTFYIASPSVTSMKGSESGVYYKNNDPESTFSSPMSLKRAEQPK